MRKTVFNLFIISLIVFSCKPKQEDDDTIPSSMLTEEQFTQILTDAYLAEGASGINVKNATGEKFDSAYLFNPITDNNIRKSQFDSSMIYYTQHPKKLKLIYEKVLEKLSQL